MSRPIARREGITLVAMLTWLSSLIEVYNGSVLLFQRDDADTSNGSADRAHDPHRSCCDNHCRYGRS